MYKEQDDNVIIDQAIELRLEKPIVIDADGRVLEATPTNGEFFTPQELQQIIGSNILITHETIDGRMMITDGQAEYKPACRVNVRATLLYPDSRIRPIYNKVLIYKP